MRLIRIFDISDFFFVFVFGLLFCVFVFVSCPFISGDPKLDTLRLIEQVERF